MPPPQSKPNPSPSEPQDATSQTPLVRRRTVFIATTVEPTTLTHAPPARAQQPFMNAGGTKPPSHLTPHPPHSGSAPPEGSDPVTGPDTDARTDTHADAGTGTGNCATCAECQSQPI